MWVPLPFWMRTRIRMKKCDGKNRIEFKMKRTKRECSFFDLLKAKARMEGSKIRDDDAENNRTEQKKGDSYYFLFGHLCYCNPLTNTYYILWWAAPFSFPYLPSSFHAVRCVDLMDFFRPVFFSLAKLYKKIGQRNFMQSFGWICVHFIFVY